MPGLTEQQAYLAMFAFLEAEWQLSKNDELGTLLGSLSLLPDGSPADSAVAKQWQSAVQAVLAGEVDVLLRLANAK